MARRKTLKSAAQLAFEALEIEGGLLAPEWLSHVAQLAAAQQSEPDYRIPKGLNLRDEIGRYWRIAQAHWGDFAKGRAANAEPTALAERFVLALLRESFGFDSLAAVPAAVVAERGYPIGFSALGLRVPVVIAPAGLGLDTLDARFGDAARRRSAFGLVQEYLNAEERALWGVVSDGLTLRIARDNASLTRPAWIAADLGRIFTEERFADFAALWLLAHETRFGEADQAVTECALETWREAGKQQGTRAREHLRDGVEEALKALGQGFLAHPDNQALRTALQDGTLSTKDYFNQLLRLVYRVIFLLTVEERGLLHFDGADPQATALYAEGYSLKRLRERAVKRSAHDRFADLWDATRIVFRGLAGGEPRLGLPALAGIFAKSQCPALDAAKLENRALLMAMFRLSWIREDSSLSRVNWRDMGPEELGSVYESLLELVPQITKDGRQFAFATGGETKGNARKTSGSYYTPDSLVQVLLDSALEPVIESTVAANPEKPVEALLQLSIVDPACGSGHFLLAAARRLAAHVARRQANGTPSAAEYRHALRQVIGHCIYGVDLNPMAVELCKVSLWMEAVEPGLPLTFLNSHIQHGNALLGTTPDLMAKGIPDAAWDPIEGDDKKVASALKKRNKAGAGGQRSLDLSPTPTANDAEVVARAVTELEAASDDDADALAKKESRWDGILESPAYRHEKLIADAWCAAFVWPKQAGALAEAAPTNERWRQIRDGQGKPPALTVKTTQELAERNHFLHWHLAFPQVFTRGGFDVVLGNPPWERVKLQEQEFFASRSRDIANAPSAAARKKLIAVLASAEPALWGDWSEASRAAQGESHFIRHSGMYPLCGRGDVNTYAAFAEHNRSTVNCRGRAGFMVPTGIATDESTKDYFEAISTQHQLASFFSFENEDRIFPAVHHAFKFALMTLDGSGATAQADLVFFARNAAALNDSGRRFRLSAEEFMLLKPNTRTCPTFRSRRDADLTIAIYRRWPVLLSERDASDGQWKIEIGRMFHTSDDSSLFVESAPDDGSHLALYESKCFGQYDHRFSTFRGAGEYEAPTPIEELDPHFHVRTRFVVTLESIPTKHANRLQPWCLAYRRITNATNERGLLTAVLPECGLLDSANLITTDRTASSRSLMALLNSFVVDYCCRQSIGGTNLHVYIIQQIPVPPPVALDPVPDWHVGQSFADWIGARVLELTYTAWDLEPFAHDVGYDGPPFRWDPERRFLLRCELDAAFFHLYGLSRNDTDYVMDTFPIVRKHDEKAHSGKYRTKDTIVEIYDAMAEAARTGTAYQTRLDPLPAAPGASHGTFLPNGTPKDYAEALRTGLLFTFIRQSGDAGVSSGLLARALLWVQDSKHAASWLEGEALAHFERARDSRPLLAENAEASRASTLLAALETAKTITHDAKGIARLRAGGSIPHWLPQTQALTELAHTMRDGLERAERGTEAAREIEALPSEKATRA